MTHRQCTLCTYRGKRLSAKSMGIPFRLPSDFAGSDENMRKRLLDAMTVCSEYGYPVLFITLTCNHRKPEVAENLFDGQPYQDKSDLVTRSFKLTVKELVNDRSKKEIRGPVNTGFMPWN